jgi:general secretion pathway protein A
MYERFFQLEKTPFSTVPDPSFAQLVGQHADVVGGLLFGVMSRKGYLVLTAEAGLGKTTALGVMSHLMADSNVQTSVILNPILTAPEFMEMMMLNFGFTEIPSSKAQRLKTLHDFLVRSDAEGRVTALVIDEAHKLSAELLEEVRLLGNFEASDHKLLQIVLVGQEELNDRLNLPELWQLKQRVTIRMSLRRMDRDSVEQYLRFRWSTAGAKDAIPFGEEAVDAIARWSLGIPRLINAICDNALLLAFSDVMRVVEVRHVRDACTELQLPTPAIEPRLVRVTAPAVPQPKPVQEDLLAAPLEADRYAGPNLWTDGRPSLLRKWLRIGTQS